jgi:hypothetical protein
MAATINFENRQIGPVGFVPIAISEGREPQQVSPESDRGQAIVNYVRAVTEEAGYRTTFRADGNLVLVEEATDS